VPDWEGTPLPLGRCSILELTTVCVRVILIVPVAHTRKGGPGGRIGSPPPPNDPNEIVG
jgi:hypothetical protein